MFRRHPLLPVSFLILWSLPADAEERVPSFKELTPEARGRIDRLTRTYPPETVKQEGVDLAGGAAGWLISRAPLSAEEEADAAGALHEKILRKREEARLPRAAGRLFRKLVEELPGHMRPKPYVYTLTGLEGEEPDVFATGAGRVYLTRPLAESLLAGGERGEAALAFLLARELGHTGLGHCRRGWQVVKLQEDVEKDLLPRIDERKARKWFITGVHTSDEILYFLYSRHQEYEADLFALHLCRNAGIAEDEALDGMRYLAALEYPRLLTDPDYVPDTEKAGSTWRYFLTRESSPFRRLRRLLLERDGKFDDESEHGLFCYDAETEEWKRCPDRAVAAGERPVVLVHGLRGGEETFDDLAAFLAESEEVEGRPVLLFRYPNNDSLTRAGRYLDREMKRAVTAPREAFFVCHSAGGLVFRYYAEKRGGEFDRAITLGTPHGGSDLTGLKFLADLFAFQKELLNGWDGVWERTIPEGRGQVVHDLRPGSLFLRHLGHDRKLARRYHVFSGRCLNRFEATSLQVAFAAGKEAAEAYTAREVPAVWRDYTDRWLDRLRLPGEVTKGDLVVTVASAELKGAGRTTRTKLNHLELRNNKKVMAKVLDSITEEW